MTKNTFLLFRVLTSLIFIVAGIGHILNPGKVFAKLSHSTIYEWMPMHNFFYVIILFTGLFMIIAGIFLIVNFKIQLAATALLLILIPITLSVQLENLNDLGPFFKNVAIAGSLIVLIKRKHYEIH